MEEETVNLADYIKVLWRRRYLVVLGTLICALTAFAVSKLMSKVYEATATLVLMPPRFATELKPPTLSVPAYQTLLESDYIKSKVKQELMDKNLIEKDEDIRGLMKAKVFTGRQPEQPYSPLINLVVEADEPEKAEIIANTWAQIFVEESLNLSLKGKSGALEFIEKQYPLSSSMLVRLENELKTKNDQYEKKLYDLQNKWDLRLTNFNNETEQLVLDFINETERLKKEHEKETERLKLEFINKWKPDLLKEELKIKENKITKFEDDLLETEMAIKSKGDYLEQIKKEIETQPKYLVLSKAITDEALWDRIGNSSDGSLPKELDKLKLRSELLNPTYQNLLERLANTQIEYDTLIPRKAHLLKESERIKKEIDDLKSLITEKDIEFIKLIKERELSYENLIEQRKAELATLKRNRELDLKLLERERDEEINTFTRANKLMIERLKRDLENVKTTYSTLAKKYETARLAKAEEEADVKIGALAVAPERPIKPKVMLNTAVGLVFGLMMSVMLSFFTEFLQSTLLTEETKSK